MVRLDLMHRSYQSVQCHQSVPSHPLLQFFQYSPKNPSNQEFRHIPKGRLVPLVQLNQSHQSLQLDPSSPKIQSVLKNQ